MATAADFARIGNYARMYNPDQNIDRLKCKRTVPMQVLCLGYSRTGTLTMQKALEVLGIPTYHFSSMYDNVREGDLWMKALDAKFDGKGEIPGKDFWDGLLGHVGGVTDAPCNLFARELMVAYPDAKVVLVEREMESWYRSWMDFCKSSYSPIISALGRLDPYWAGRITALGGLVTRIESGHAVDIDQAKVRSKDAYKHHYRDVRELIGGRESRLLNFDLKQGWKPLCDFLGKPVPNEPFPHENDKESNRKGFEELGVIAMKHILKNVLLLAVALSVPILLVAYAGTLVGFCSDI
ncbi:hypothetical protein H2200_001202 [Cladophialophora chaetospira]|uniref:Efflux pump antibiotic resistance protein n=1 Tax=Cladophialophora chaetospira TaxID=386627 RepID=A0AA39CMU5_9EURO|nr:hypothetical protein H2200_001202 [Cladophialophora chaetospira]